jgi:glycosidase
MQWDDTQQAGFSKGEISPWLPIHANYEQVNARVQNADPESLLNTYKSLLQIRKSSKPLQEGALHLLENTGQILAYIRKSGKDQVLVLLNFGSTEFNFNNQSNCRQEIFKIGELSVTNLEHIKLGPFAGAILSS